MEEGGRRRRRDRGKSYNLDTDIGEKAIECSREMLLSFSKMNAKLIVLLRILKCKSNYELAAGGPSHLAVNLFVSFSVSPPLLVPTRNL